ncbi:hypothetical protein LCGC14_2084790 [marine sediment metagenome]|uniref:Uncharacterized protein n=1 Tax=marine sediment metagenome TaxID=412755 RepID=A0A0F9F1T1_9ZZZZ
MPDTYEYSRVHKSEKFFPLWEAQLRQNWNLEDTIKQEGEFKTIRLFYTKWSAELFITGLNILLELIKDVPE